MASRIRPWTNDPDAFEGEFIPASDIDRYAKLFHEVEDSSSPEDGEDLDLDDTPDMIVPGFAPDPPYPRLSSLTRYQHYLILKMKLNTNNTPAQIRHPLHYYEVNKLYENEMEHFKNWFNHLWTNSYYLRMLNTTPLIENFYDAEFEVAANRLKHFPKDFFLATDISLAPRNAYCELNKYTRLFNQGPLPRMRHRNPRQRVYVTPYEGSMPCKQHTCRIILPNENEITKLPLTAVHKRLADYAAENQARFIASEEALRCLVELKRNWSLCMSVFPITSENGKVVNIVVLDSEFSLKRETIMVRMQKIYRKLLENTVYHPPDLTSPNNNVTTQNSNELSNDDSEDEGKLVIDTNPNSRDCSEDENVTEGNEKHNADQPSTSKAIDDSKFDKCTCNYLDKSPSRYYAKCNITNMECVTRYTFIVHGPRPAVLDRSTQEVVVEPIPEYQLDVAASKLTSDANKSQGLALKLRKAGILNFRINASTGEMVKTKLTTESDPYIDLDLDQRLFGILHQLKDSEPGHYVLKHEKDDDDIAGLYSEKESDSAKLTLKFDRSQFRAEYERESMKIPPVLCRETILPIHKFRNVLPCAFTSHVCQMPQHRRPVVRDVRRSRSPPAEWRNRSPPAFEHRICTPSAATHTHRSRRSYAAHRRNLSARVIDAHHSRSPLAAECRSRSALAIKRRSHSLPTVDTSSGIAETAVCQPASETYLRSAAVAINEMDLRTIPENGTGTTCAEPMIVISASLEMEAGKELNTGAGPEQATGAGLRPEPDTGSQSVSALTYPGLKGAY